MTLLQAGESPDFLTDRTLAELRDFGGLNDEDQLENTEIQARLSKDLTQALAKSGDDNQTAGSIIAALRESVLQTKPANGLPDNRDMLRGWGWKLLRDDDPAFRDPTYLAHMLMESGATGAGMVNNPGGDIPFAQRAFEAEWTRLVPDSVEVPNAFALTGTQANNLLYEIAADVVLKRRFNADPTYSPNPTIGHPGNILVFSGTYRGKNGPIAHPDEVFMLPDATTETWGGGDEKTLAAESKALQLIEEKVNRPELAIGGVFLEPIASYGVKFYRPEFLIRLRNLCDRLDIPIFADEVMTGGGRTGKFFAYQNYEGFEPDYVTFGKGLIVAGVARVKREWIEGSGMRWRISRFPGIRTTSSTLTNHNELFWKSAQILKRIRTGNLIANSAEVGAYFLSRILEKSAAARGKGMMIFGSVPYAVTSFGRLLPYLSLTHDEVDALMNPPSPK